MPVIKRRDRVAARRAPRAHLARDAVLVERVHDRRGHRACVQLEADAFGREHSGDCISSSLRQRTLTRALITAMRTPSRRAVIEISAGSSIAWSWNAIASLTSSIAA
jgi:hypothetical protein